jgi:hypothetical protein
LGSRLRGSQFKVDGFVKSPVCSLNVIPAKLVLDLIGEQESSLFKLLWTPAFAGVTQFFTFCTVVKVRLMKIERFEDKQTNREP